MGHSIIWTNEATADFDDILSFLGRDSKRYAVRLRDEIYEGIEHLAEFPMIGRSVPEVDDKRLREIFVGQYRVLYYFDGTDISIISLVHMSRDLVQFWHEHR